MIFLLLIFSAAAQEQDEQDISDDISSDNTHSEETQDRIQSCEDIHPEKYFEQIVAFYNHNVVEGDYHYATLLIGSDQKVTVQLDNDAYTFTVDNQNVMHNLQTGSNTDAPEATLFITTDRCTVRDILNSDLSLDEALDSERIQLQAVSLGNKVRVLVLNVALDVYQAVRGWFS